MLWRIFRRSASTNSFVYPQRIPRSATDILQSLNSTTQNEGSNPSYIYMDDPFLIPTSSFEKRQYALSKSSGKKAARWIMDRYPYAFYYDTAAPTIPSFFPNYKFSEKDFIDADENTIYKLISWNQLTKAFQIYEQCLKDNVKISPTCQFALFDSLCIFNSQNPDENLSAEENWYRTETKRTWKENGEAEKMFEQLKTTENPSEQFRLYNSFVCGLLKFNQIEKAMKIIDEMKEKKISFDLTTFNFLLRSTHLIGAQHDFILEQLRQMKEQKIRPNLRTFNSILSSLRRFPINERNPSFTLKILNEMKQCGIEPSLGTWAHVIMIFYPTDQIGVQTGIFPQILEHLEKQSNLQWRDIDDGEFFFNAMFRATVTCRDVDLAKRLHRFLLNGSNIRFLPDGMKEQMYYTNLFRLLFRIDTPEEVIPLWESLVPNIYSPSINIIEELMEFISIWNLKDYHVRLWSDLLILGFLDNRQNNRRIVEKYFNLLTRIDQDQLDNEQRKQYANIARQILKRFPLVPEEEEQNDDERTKKEISTPKFEYNGQILSNLIYLLSQSEDFQSSWNLFEYYLDNRNVLITPLSERSLMSLFSLSIKEKNVEHGFTLLQMLNDFNYESFATALDQFNRNIQLNHQDRQRLRTIQKNSSIESAHLVKLI